MSSPSLPPGPPHWRDRRAAPRSWLVVAGACAALTAACIGWIDAPLARWLATRDTWPGLWERGITVIEDALGLPISSFALPIALVVGMIATAAVRRWRGHAPAWMFVAATHLIARIATGWIKTATSRLRPSEWLALPAARAHALGDATFWQPGGVAFPSGHVVLVASVIVPLAIVAPRVGRPLLIVVAFVAAARVAVAAHFASDVIGAVALVALVAAGCAAAIRPLTFRT